MRRIAKQTITPETWESFGLTKPEPEVIFHNKRKWRVDFVFTAPDGRRLAVEVHGGVYVRGAHSRGYGQIQDFIKGRNLTLYGFYRMEFTPKEVSTGYAATVVKEFLEGGNGDGLDNSPEERGKVSKKKAMKLPSSLFSVPRRKQEVANAAAREVKA